MTIFLDACTLIYLIEGNPAFAAKVKTKLAQLMQAASCLQLGKEHIFLTGDKAFSRVHGLNCEIVAAT